MAEASDRFPLRRAYPFLAANGLEEEADEIQTSTAGLRPYTSLVRRGKITELLKRQNLLDKFIADEWPYGATDRGKRSMDRQERLYQRFLDGELGPEREEDEERDDLEETRFAYEADLRDYLAKNLHLIEQGLKLWPTGDDTRAIEYLVDTSGRRVDILACDGSGIPVVIELKVSRGHERTIGQALYYQAMIKQGLAVERARIVIVAREIGAELAMACSSIPDVALFEYRLSLTLSPAPAP